MVSIAAFSLEKYKFNKVNIDFDSNETPDLIVDFKPSGIFKQVGQESIYELKLVFTATDRESDNPFITVDCHAIFKFINKIEFQEIPTYFYANCIAIIFPYIRAFVSTVTLQAHIPLIVLPTMNLSSLEEPLKRNTVEA